MTISCCIGAGKPPLYFQHEGHSRTIVGVERFKADEATHKGRLRRGLSADGFIYNILLLDPSFKTKDLAAAFKSGRNWQVCQ